MSITVTTSIITDHESWCVTNMMFDRIMAWLIEVGREFAVSDIERAWVAELGKRLPEDGYWFPDTHCKELFPVIEQVEFWSAIASEVADRVYQRRLGNQADQSWQVSTIWAAFDLNRMLTLEARRRRYERETTRDA
jgi:hypothetical protein